MLTVHGPGEQPGYHVIARTIAALLGELIRISEYLGGADARVDLHIRLVVPGHLVAPLEELDTVFFGDTDQFGDGLHG
ncbi:Uncharacterised protein [Mycobacteroides abscessus subsp. abscessus]|nr:Uncharacterised protein [Mycobacteroides abscessus subsp. abscessus]